MRARVIQARTIVGARAITARPIIANDDGGAVSMDYSFADYSSADYS